VPDVVILPFCIIVLLLLDPNTEKTPVELTFAVLASAKRKNPVTLTFEPVNETFPLALILAVVIPELAVMFGANKPYVIPKFAADNNPVTFALPEVIFALTINVLDEIPAVVVNEFAEIALFTINPLAVIPALVTNEFAEIALLTVNPLVVTCPFDVKLLVEIALLTTNPFAVTDPDALKLFALIALLTVRMFVVIVPFAVKLVAAIEVFTVI